MGWTKPDFKDVPGPGPREELHGLNHMDDLEEHWPPGSQSLRPGTGMAMWSKMGRIPMPLEPPTEIHFDGRGSHR
jgi:hypothetical protein